jgi:hypothetical protein
MGSKITFDLQRFLFVLTIKKIVKLMMQKPFAINLLIELWRTISPSQIFE